MLDQEFLVCLQYWVGIRLFSDGPCPRCSLLMDASVITGWLVLVMVIKLPGITQYMTSTAANLAALSPKLEAPYLLPSSEARPADVYLPIWSATSLAALEITVTSLMQHLTINQAGISQGYALEVAAKRMTALYGSSCRQVGIQFIPLPVETLGSWSVQAASTIQEVGCHQAVRLHSPPSDSILDPPFQRLSICLWRGNA